MRIKNNIRLSQIRFLVVLSIAMAVSPSCSVRKYIPEEEFLYTGAKLDIEKDENVKDFKRVEAELEDVLRPEPNSKFLGVRWGLYFHYKAQDNPNFITRFLNKKMGEEPVYESQVDLQHIEKVLNNRLENQGFFLSSVSSEVIRKEKKKQSEAVYKLNVAEPYLIENYTVEADSLPIYKDIRETMEESIIKIGNRFNLNALKVERERIDRALKLKGYYNFNPDFLVFEADTNQHKKRSFDLFLRLKKEAPQAALIPYRLTKVEVHPNYILGNRDHEETETELNGKTYVQGEVFFKPERLDPFILLKEGDYFNPNKSRYTSRRLGSIGAYRFINIQYEEIDSLSTSEEGALKANIYLSPMKKRVLRTEIQMVSKSNNFTGPGIVATISNRNLFKGGETLNISTNFGYEMQIASGGQEGLHTIQAGLEPELIFPRMLSPIPINTNFFRYSIPKTKIALSMQFQNRSQLYSLVGTTATFGYLWNANRYVSHQFNPISVNYLHLANTSSEFEEILNQNPFLKNSLDQKFIAGLTYSFTYNGLIDQQRAHQFYFNTNLDIAGNLVNLLSGGGDRPREVLGLEYSQYAKVDVDFRYHLQVGSSQKIATRIFAGIGIPYGNSEVMPFSRQYYSGGPFSVRAFRIRSLGPGNYNPEQSSGTGSFFDQTGNLRLEANLEYRFPIISFLKGALFADAGNVWNTDDNSLTGGKFSSKFIDELGIGVGAGLRVDVQNFVIRFDLASPIHTPYLPVGERWYFDYKNPILNFAIGYPF